MRFGRTSKAVATAALAVLALSACASTDEGGEGNSTDGGSTQAAGGNVTVAEVNAFSSFNANSATGNVDINSKIWYMTHGDFYWVDKDLKVQRNEGFATYERISQDPLTVKYTMNENAKWSDGTPIDAGDMMLWWAVQSGHFDDATTNDAGEVTSGNTYFSYAGTTDGLGLTDVPEIGDDGRSITMTYAEPYADWEIAFDGGLPAHVVAEGAGLADEQALTDLIMSSPEGDPENPQDRPKLKKVADYWNTAFDTTTLPSNPAMYLSSGPYVVDSMVPDQSITLVRNENYQGEREVSLDEITVRYIPEAPAQVQALQNGEVDIIAPQPSADTLQSLEALNGIQLQVGNQLSFDHLDLNYSGVFKDVDVRKAFMNTIPRDAIVNSTVKPINPDAAPRDSHIFDMGTDGYKAAVQENGSENWQEVDIQKAKQLLDGRTPEVRIMYNADNPNRADAYTLIAESAEKAGFKVVDGGLPGAEWGNALGSGRYDATIFGWISEGVGVSGVPQLYGCGSSSNFSGFCDEEAQQAMDDLIRTTDPQRQQELQITVDTRLFETGYGLPLFQSPGIQAADERVEGVEYMSNQTGVFWNFWEWSIAQ
jgi:ABC-type transport system substrate-binding protein